MNRKANGFSLIEILIMISIGIFILLAAVQFFVTGSSMTRIIISQQQATETARLQLKRITIALREARPSDTGAYPLMEISPQKIVFYSDIDNDNVTERVRYELIGSNLERGILKPQGSPLTYTENQENKNIVASRIVNGATPIFTYYSGDYLANTTELQPADITNVRYIQFHLIVGTTNNKPAPIDIISQVQLRNLKTNLGDTP